MLEANQLNIFLAAAETLNFSRAAERLHMSQPSVSQHIQLLESHFGCPLFERKGRQMQLTEAGTALIPLARQMVAVSLRTDEVMAHTKGDIQGNLTIGCTTTPGKYYLPAILAKFINLYPRVNATCNVQPQSQAMQMLDQGLVHVAISSNPDKYSSNVEFRKLFDDPIILLVPSSHEWAHRDRIQPQELLGARFIMREENSGTYRMVRTSLSRFGISILDLRPVLTLGNSEAIAIAIEEGIGVGFVSQVVANRLCNERSRQVLIEGLDIHQEIYAGRNRHYAESRLLAAFWDYLTSKPQDVIQQFQKTVLSAGKARTGHR